MDPLSTVVSQAQLEFMFEVLWDSWNAPKEPRLETAIHIVR